ncbi:MAG TPA: UxaA family hydrolase [Terracidiphilus sp.]|nr:UxaA family hydrolase [Terracidiphilus sp.]
MRPGRDLSEYDMAECFQIAAMDNVATLLRDAEPGTIAVRGEGERREIPVTQPLGMGHKVALCAIGEGEPVVKYGVTVGVATRPIAPGEWVHLHNCKSLCDAGSSKLDLVTGARGETPYV